MCLIKKQTEKGWCAMYKYDNITDIRQQYYIFFQFHKF